MNSAYFCIPLGYFLFSHFHSHFLFRPSQDVGYLIRYHTIYIDCDGFHANFSSSKVASFATRRSIFSAFVSCLGILAIAPSRREGVRVAVTNLPDSTVPAK